MRYSGVKVRDARQTDAFLVTREAHNLGKWKDACSSRGQRDAGAEGEIETLLALLAAQARRHLPGKPVRYARKKARDNRVVTATETAPTLAKQVARMVQSSGILVRKVGRSVCVHVPVDATRRERRCGGIS